jgi:hypothetical protein
VYLAENFHLPEVADYWRHVVTMDDYQKSTTMIRGLVNTLNNKKICIFGFGFKKDTCTCARCQLPPWSSSCWRERPTWLCTTRSSSQ